MNREGEREREGYLVSVISYTEFLQKEGCHAWCSRDGKRGSARTYYVHAIIVVGTRRREKKEETYGYCSSRPSIQRGIRAPRSGYSCNDRSCRPSACTGSRNPSRNNAPRKSPCTRTPSSNGRSCTRPRSNLARRPTTFA